MHNVVISAWFMLMALNIFLRMEGAQAVVTWVSKYKVGAYMLAFMRQVGADPVKVVEEAELLMSKVKKP